MGAEPPCTPPALTTGDWGDTGAARFQAAATCSAGCSPSFVFLSSKPGEVARGAFPQKEKAGTWPPNPLKQRQLRPTALPREIQEWAQKVPGLSPHSPPLSRYEKGKPTLLFPSRLRSKGQQPIPGQEPFSEQVPVFAPHTPEVGLGLLFQPAKAAIQNARLGSLYNRHIFLSGESSGGWGEAGPVQQGEYSALSLPVPNFGPPPSILIKKKKKI